MKSVVTIVLLLLALATSAQAQMDVWVSQNSPESGPTLRAIQTVGPNKAYAVGDQTSFAIIKDTDCSYHLNITPYSDRHADTFEALSFLDQMTGVVVGGNNKRSHAIRTTNAGASWDSLPLPTNSYCSGVLMISKDIIIIVGSNNLLIRSSDGGKTWKQYGFVETNIGLLKSIKKITENFIIITGANSFFLFSADSGKSWTMKKTIFANQINGVDFENDSMGIAVGEYGYIISTSNKGKDWSRHVIDTGYVAQTSINGIESTGPDWYVAVGEGNLTMYSTDKGIHWAQSIKDGWSVGIEFYGLSMWNSTDGYACGSAGYCVRTTDGGLSWKFIPKIPIIGELYSIAYPKGDTLNGITVGETRSILQTTNGGLKWNNVTDPTIAHRVGIDLNYVTFADATTAFVVGDEGTMAKSTDRGRTWKKLYPPTKHDLHSVFFLDSKTGWVGDDSGTVLKTTDGGEKWQYIYCGDRGDSIFSISFCDKLNGMAGKFRTNDGGITWLQPTVYFEGQFKASLMLSPSHYLISSSIVDGWGNPVIGNLRTFIGDSIYLLKATYVEFYDIAFGDSLHGTAVGRYRKANPGSADIRTIICQTTDGGKTWESQENPGHRVVYGVTMPLPNVASASGWYATILRRVNTPQVASIAEHSPATNSPFEIISLYPNPAREASTILLHISQPTQLELRLFDVRGAEVKYLDLGLQSEGEYDIPVDFSGLSSGSYIIELRSASQAKHIQLKVQ